MSSRIEVLEEQAGDPAESPELVGDSVAPVVPDELIKGDWQRHLVLPDQHGHLRLTSVQTERNGKQAPSTSIRYLDEPRRYSA